MFISKNKKRAFTLAEVLITLAIIGVVAAMAIPALLVAIDKRSTISKLKRSLSVISNAQLLSDEGTGGISHEAAMAMGNEAYFKMYWAPYMNVLKYCNTYQSCGYSSNTPFVAMNGRPAASSLMVVHSSRISFITPDGFLYIITNARMLNGGGTKENSANVVVDINGPAIPNRFGRDVFVFQRTEDGSGVLTLGYDLSDEEVKAGCSISNQSEPVSKGYCAEWIRREGWRIPKDYPW